jgi:acyl carrier protein
MNGASSRRAALREWIGQRAGPVADDTPLIADRLIDSLQIVELVLFLEELTGRSVRPEQLEPGAFSDIETICRRFFDEAAQPEASA